MNLHNVMDTAKTPVSQQKSFEGWEVKEGKLQAPKGWFTQEAIIGFWTKSSLAAAQKRYDDAVSKEKSSSQQPYAWYNPIGYLTTAFQALINLISSIFNCFGLCGEENEASKESTKK